MCRLPLFIASMAHFSMPNPIPISWLNYHTVCIRVSNSFSFLVKSLISSMYVKWLNYACDLLCLYLAVHFQRMWLNGIMAITNSNGDSASPWNMPLWVFTSAQLFPPTVNSTLQICMIFSINCTTWPSILYIFRQFIQLLGTISLAFCSPSRP